MDVLAWDQVQPDLLAGYSIARRRRGNPSKRKQVQYFDTFATFDIECSTITYQGAPHAICYMWMLYFIDRDLMITGRMIGDFVRLLDRIRDARASLVIYVHNLSYEFVQLSGVYNFAPEEVFAIKARKIAKCSMFGSYEFRCSYLLSNMSLALYTKKYGVQHAKLSGKEYNYSKSRYPWTPLTARELEYCYHDVIGLAECIQIELQIGKLNIYDIPLTSTGFVRRDLKSAMRLVRHDLVRDMLPDFDIQLMLKKAFRGGDVHANKAYANTIIPGPVHSVDRSSSYPDVLINCKFPMSKWTPLKNCTIDGALREMARGRALLLKISIHNARLKNIMWPDPCLSESKCELLYDHDDVKTPWAERGTILDNGRVIKCPYLITTITDIDLRMIVEQYDGDIDILEGYASRYGFLPDPYRDTIISYYVQKTALKGDSEKAPFYEKSKNKLNSNFGCAAQDPIKLETYFCSDGYEDPEGLWREAGDPMAIYEEYTEKAWSSYSWGVWCTAWARWRLYEGIKIVSAEQPWGHDDSKRSDFIYCDTDSVKYIGEAEFSEYNDQRRADSIANYAHAVDSKGITHYMGVFEPDEPPGGYRRFITLGAKKYAYTDHHGRIHITIAGVNKRLGAEEVRRAGGLQRLQYTGEGHRFIFRRAGGSELIYNDRQDYGTTIIDGHELRITRNVVIRDSTYALGLGEDYETLLAMRTEWVDI